MTSADRLLVASFDGRSVELDCETDWIADEVRLRLGNLLTDRTPDPIVLRARCGEPAPQCAEYSDSAGAYAIGTPAHVFAHLRKAVTRAFLGARPDSALAARQRGRHRWLCCRVRGAGRRREEHAGHRARHAHVASAGGRQRPHPHRHAAGDAAALHAGAAHEARGREFRQAPVARQGAVSRPARHASLPHRYPSTPSCSQRYAPRMRARPALSLLTPAAGAGTPGRVVSGDRREDPHPAPAASRHGVGSVFRNALSGCQRSW